MDYRFLLTVESRGPVKPRQRTLYSNLRQAIVDGRFAAHHKLPSSRDLAGQLEIARNTVVYAFEQLCAEGYLVSSKRGTVVAAIPAPPPLPRRSPPTATLSGRLRDAARARSAGEDLGVFTPGIPALDAFPLVEWQATLKRTFRETRPAHLSYGDVAGVPALRAAISERLRAARGLTCVPEQVFITDGTQSALDLLARSLADPGSDAWMENPGYGGARAAFRAAGLSIRSLPVDGAGMTVDEAAARPAPRLIYVTPSHQYPMGSVLSLGRRMELLKLARRLGAVILEDDYDSDFRYDGAPLPSLQGLIPDAPVIYLGTFSKTLFPGLRLGYLVAPPPLIEPLREVFAAVTRHGRQIEQTALARFIVEGRYTRHLYRMRKLYHERQRALRAALAHRLPQLDVRGAEAGLHLVLLLPHGSDDREVCRRARRHSLSPNPLSDYGDGQSRVPPGLVLGYGNTPAESMNRHVRTLAGCLRR